MTLKNVHILVKNNAASYLGSRQPETLLRLLSCASFIPEHRRKEDLKATTRLAWTLPRGID